MIIGCVFYTFFPTCEFLMLCSCIAHSHLLHTPLLLLPCLSLYHISSSLACHVYFMLCSIVFLRCFVFCLSFIFSSILHPSCIITLVHIFISFPPSSLSICPFMTKRGRVYWRVYRRVLSFLYESSKMCENTRVV